MTCTYYEFDINTTAITCMFTRSTKLIKIVYKANDTKEKM